MKQLTIVLLLSVVGHLCYGQNKNLDARYAVKLYNITSWEKQQEPFQQGIFMGKTTEKEFQLLHPSLAFRIKNAKNNFHEIELTELEVGKENSVSEVDYNGIVIPIQGSNITNTTIAVRYEYTLNFNKKKNSRFMPALGLAIMPYYQRTNFTPVLSTQYPVANTHIGAKGYLVPRLNYAISSRLFLDLNIPICITDTYMEMVNTKNPNITQQEQKHETGNFDGVPNRYSFRIGLGLTI
jgi:hypothetical protein